MLEVNYNREESTLVIKNVTSEEHIVLTTYYNDGKSKGEFGGSIKLIPNDSIILND